MQQSRLPSMCRPMLQISTCVGRRMTLRTFSAAGTWSTSSLTPPSPSAPPHRKCVVDITTSNHHYPLRKLLQIKGFVGGNGMFCPGNIRLERPATGGNNNALGRDGLLTDAHLMRAGQSGRAVQNGDAGVLK